jgi:uncharacterized protein
MGIASLFSQYWCQKDARLQPVSTDTEETGMHWQGRYRFGAPPSRVWAALFDTEIVKRTIPGCTRIDWVGENALEAVVTIDFGLFKQRFTGDFILTDIVPIKSYTLSGRGRGGLLGHAHGAADFALAEDSDDTCLLAFTATAGASGAIQRLGSALIGKSVQHVIDGFFFRFAEAMGVKMETLAQDIDTAGRTTR